MLNPYGSSPILAMWQGFLGGDPSSLQIRTAYGCVVTNPSVGLYVLQLNTGVDDATILLQLQLFGVNPVNPIFPQIAYGLGGPPFNQQVQLTFTDSSGNPIDPPGLWNIVVYDANDGIDESPGRP